MVDQEIRAFISIELPDELRKRMGEFQDGLRRPQHRSIKWVNPASVHLTLKFLGNIKTRQQEAIGKELSEIAKASKPFSIVTSNTGCFPNLKRARVFWLGLDGDIGDLLKLQGSIDRALAPLGFPPENRPFTAHLTLARVKDECSPTERAEFSGLVEHAGFEKPVPVKVESIALMQSRLTPGGAIYTRLAEYRLTGR